MPSPLLRAIRQAVYDNMTEYRSIVEDPLFKQYFPVVGETFLKTAPKGFPKDYPYLKYLPIFPSRRPLIRSTPPFRCLSMIGWMEARSLARMAAMRSLWSSTIAL